MPPDVKRAATPPAFPGFLAEETAGIPASPPQPLAKNQVLLFFPLSRVKKRTEEQSITDVGWLPTLANLVPPSPFSHAAAGSK